VVAFFTVIYGFVAIFVLSSLERNRRQAVMDGPVLSFAGHGLMAGSATAAAIVAAFAMWSALAH